MTSGQHDRRSIRVPAGESGRADGGSVERRNVEEVACSADKVLLALRFASRELAGHLDFYVLVLGIELLDAVRLLRYAKVEGVAGRAESTDLSGQFALVVRQIFSDCVLNR